MSALMSMSGVSGVGFRIPPTSNHRPPSQTRRPRGDRAEHRDGHAGSPLVEPVAACDAGAENGQQAEARGPHLEPAGFAHRDQRAPVDLLVVHQGGVGHQVDVVQERDPRRRLVGQQCRPAGEALSGLDGQQVRAQPVDLCDQTGLGGGGQAENAHDRRGPDRDPERGQRGPQRPGSQPDTRDPQPVPRRQPSARGTHGSPSAVSVTTSPSSTRIWRGS